MGELGLFCIFWFDTEDAEDFAYDLCAGWMVHFCLLFGLLCRPLCCDALYHRTGQKSNIKVQNCGIAPPEADFCFASTSACVFSDGGVEIVENQVFFA